MLRAHAGKWQRWLALFETHCLASLRPADVAAGLLLPSGLATAVEQALGATLPAVQCEEDDSVAVPVFAPRLRRHAVLTEGALGRCAGVLFLPTGSSLLERRALLRGTWLGGDFPGVLRPLGCQRANEPEVADDDCMDYFFLSGWADSLTLRQGLRQEREEFGDVIVDCTMQDAVPTYGGLQHKFFKSLAIQQRLFPSAKYVVRASDDTYLHAPRLAGLVALYGPHRLYFGRETLSAVYRESWPLHAEYLRAFGHDRLPGVIVGDVLALSEDLVELLLADQAHRQHWAHFDDTVGVWLSAVDGVRRVPALRPDREWVEWFEVMRGEVACPEGKLVVGHSPAWKEWQNNAAASVLTVPQEFRREEDHDVILEFMMLGISRGVRSTREPCFIDEETYLKTYRAMIEKLVKYNWQRGVRMEGQHVDVVHGPPKKDFVGYTAGMPTDGQKIW